MLTFQKSIRNASDFSLITDHYRKRPLLLFDVSHLREEKRKAKKNQFLFSPASAAHTEEKKPDRIDR